MLFARRDAIADLHILGRELGELLLQPLFRKYAVHPPQIVHYTSIQTLEAILASGNLRMTHFRHLNDSTEMLHGRRVINQLLSAEAASNAKTAAFFDYCRFFFNEVGDDAIQYFVTSFSALPDSPDLWARYGVRGAGVAITFDTLRMGAAPNDSGPYYIGRVTYSAEDQLELISPLIAAAKIVASRYIARHGYDVRDVAVQALAAKLCSNLNHHSISLKDHDPWQVEEEWRTVFSVLQNDSRDRKDRVQRGSDGRPFVDVPVLTVDPNRSHMPIAMVTVGTAAERLDVEAVLRRHGYGHVAVGKSAIDLVDLPSWQ